MFTLGWWRRIYGIFAVGLVKSTYLFSDILGDEAPSVPLCLCYTTSFHLRCISLFSSTWQCIFFLVLCTLSLCKGFTVVLSHFHFCHILVSSPPSLPHGWQLVINKPIQLKQKLDSHLLWKTSGLWLSENRTKTSYLFPEVLFQKHLYSGQHLSPRLNHIEVEVSSWARTFSSVRNRMDSSRRLNAFLERDCP